MWREEVVDEVLEAQSAGSPTDEAVRWADLEPVQLAQQVLACGYHISRNTAAKLDAGRLSASFPAQGIDYR